MNNDGRGVIDVQTPAIHLRRTNKQDTAAMRREYPNGLVRALRWAAKSSSDSDELLDAADEIERLREALGIIERWEDFPESERTWEDGTPMSYGAAFGSNGQRDYMRGIARAALAGKEENHEA